MSTKLIRFNNLNEFKQKFQHIFERDEWGKVNLNTLNLSVTDGEIFLSEEVTDGKRWEVNDLSLPTIKDRAKNNSSIQRMMDKESLCDFLNISWPYLKKEKGLYLERNGKLLAIHSDKYVVLDQVELVKRLFEKIPYNGLCFENAMYTDELTNILFAYSEKEQKRLLSELNKISKLDLIPKVLFVTSDIGEQAATYFPIVSSKGKDYIVGKALKQKHYGKVSVDSVIDMLDEVFLLSKNATGRVIELNEIILNNPIGVMEKVSQEALLPKKEVNKLIDAFLLLYDEDHPVTAYDVFISLSSINTNTSEIGKLSQKERLAKIIYLDWQKIDNKLTFDRSKYIVQMKMKEVM